MKSIKEITEHTLIIKKSEFICTLIPLNDENKINEIIDFYKEKYKDATHNCIAYLVGTKERANDDGEPSGTAGLPMLNVLKKQELSNIIAIVTRYFGGIKLGAGGLTRAYSQAVAEALKEANIVEKHLIDVYDVSLDYSFTKKFEHLLKVNAIDCINKEYSDQVTYRLYIDDLSFFDTIQELTSNRYTKEFIKKEYVPVK
ncbi:YigZ family protein [Faecalibacillus faecis]|uniref:YigZ family protein n=1 Tax=Faecalibacillus faecis TaxID=1982628 RepID=UPI002F948FA8